MIGETVSHYRVLKKLGSGGMGDVYKAEDTKLKRTVALKFLPRELTLDEEAKRRFITEARAASSLDDPNIGTIYEIDDADGTSFIAMAYYDGGSLRDRMKEGPISVEDAVNIAIQIGQGLAKAHAGGIIHRDVKPANVMLAEGLRVKIVDFGLAKLASQSVLTRTGTTLGTVAYMSPEQASGRPVDHRSDLWSVGVILHEMLAGERPFKGEYEQAVVYALLNTRPKEVTALRPEAPSVLGKIVDKALEKDPERRYQSADELVTELKTVLNILQGGGDKSAARISRLGRRQKKLLLWSTGVLVVVVILGSLLVFTERSVKDEPVIIAVLPMALDSRDENDEWLSDGMTDALITDLARIKNLRVISKRSVLRLQKTDKSLPEIARELKVAYVVDGSVGKIGDQVTVSARLADAQSDQYVWADQFEADFSEILGTQATIAGAIAEKIRGKISPAELEVLDKEQKVDPKTYEAYLKGMHHLGKFTPDDIQKGLAYLQEAIDRSPGDARAWAGLAIGYITVGHGPARTPDVWQRARAAAERAVTLDSTLAEAQAAYAIIKDYYDWDWKAAEHAFKRSIELNPSLAISHYHYAWMIVMFGRIDEAIREHELAVELDPLFPPQVAWLGDIYRVAGRYDDALRQADKALELGDRSGIAHLVKGKVYLAQHQFEKAIAEHEKMAEANPIWKGLLGATYAAAGRTDDALKIAHEVETQGVRPIDAYQLAFLYAYLGDADDAFRMVNFEPHHAFVPWLAMPWTPLYAFREDPRYKEFIKRLGMPKIASAPEGTPTFAPISQMP
ncbi:MAG: protein kinase [Rhodothermales bacterium]